MGFVPQLNSWLAGQGADILVMNAGVSGDTTAGGLARVGWSLQPDTDAMIVTLGGNDLLRGIEPSVSRANLDGILTIAAQQNVEVLLVGMEAPGNYGPDYKSEFDAIYPELAEQYGVLLEPNFFKGLSAEGDADPANVGAWMQADGIHPNAKGVALIVSAIGPRVLELAEKARQ